MAIKSFQEAINHDSENLTIYRSDGRQYDGCFSDIRIDRDTVPDGWHVYDLRENEEDDEEDEEAPLFGQIRNGYIMVNHIGTFATPEDIGLAEGESLYIRENEGLIRDDEFDYSLD